MWLYVLNSNPIWYFDATGLIHRQIHQQPKPFFYSIVCHDIINKSIIPVAEFLTTSNNQITISRFLAELNRLLDQATTTNILPKIIVTDMGWALINSVLRVFNNCDMIEYLNYCYKLLLENKVEFKDKRIKVIYYTCSTHFLVNIIKKTKGKDLKN